MPNQECQARQSLEGQAAIDKREDLEVIGVDGPRWLALLRCRKCGMYWEESYDESKGAYMGGGMPILKQVSEEYVRSEWGVGEDSAQTK